MRIVNKQFKDYYDSCMGYGVDEELVYIRATQEIETSCFTQKTKSDFAPILKLVEYKRYDNVIEHRFNSRDFSDAKDRKHSFQVGYIGFCGIIYPYIKVERSHASTPNISVEFIYDEQASLDYFKKFNLGSKKRRYSYFHNEETFTKKHFKEFFVKHRMEDIFFSIGNPIFVINRDGVQINPCLQDFQFYKLFDSFTAFQEITMFLGGVLGQAHPPIDQISDADMKIKKGFGHKYAFKKEPNK